MVRGPLRVLRLRTKMSAMTSARFVAVVRACRNDGFPVLVTNSSKEDRLRQVTIIFQLIPIPFPADERSFTSHHITAERAYASRGAAGKMAIAARVGVAGCSDWLPQETILYENCHLHREMTIDLAPDATCLFCESIVLSRHEMGEELMHARLTDQGRRGFAGWLDPQNRQGG